MLLAKLCRPGAACFASSTRTVDRTHKSRQAVSVEAVALTLDHTHVFMCLVVGLHLFLGLCPPTLGWRVGHLGGLTSPFPPPNTVKSGAGGWATAGTERGYPEPFGLLEPPAQNPGCCWTRPRHPWTPWTPLHHPPHPSFFSFFRVSPAPNPCCGRPSIH